MNWKALFIFIVIASAFIGGIVYICILDRWFFIPLLLALAAALGVMYLLRGITYPQAAIPILGLAVLVFLLVLFIYYCIFYTEVRKAIFSYLVSALKEGWYYPLLFVGGVYLLNYIENRRK